jgi:hypothetical protein
MKLFHRTAATNAKAILAEGFKDATGSIGTRESQIGVWLTNDGTDGHMIGITLIEVTLDLDEDALAAYERPAEGYRAWIVPAALVNPHMKTRIVEGG